MIQLSRRNLLRGLLAAPAIIAADRLMRVKAPPLVLTQSNRIIEEVTIRGPMTQADIDRMQGYLMHNNGMADLLPIGHPYKSHPPLRFA